MTLTADQILATEYPERLFPNDLEEARSIFVLSAKQWHPDLNKDPKAAQVMAHISALYEKVREKIAAGTWTPLNTFVFKGEGKVRTIRYKKRRAFELGELLIGDKHASFVVPKKYDDAVLRGLRAVGSIRYPRKEWKADLERFFPKVERLAKDETNGGQVISVLKDENAILLQDLLDHLGGQLDPRHTAWVISSLLNICAFFSVTGVTHNGLSPETVFVSPKHHCVYLLGGWWYSAKVGSPIKLVPRFSFNLLTSVERGHKLATPRLDLECVKEIGRICIGKALKDLPKPYVEFLKFPASAKAVDEYASWEKVLKDSYGVRRFIKLDVTPSAVYGG